MKNPDAILHAGCSPVTWFGSIACSASDISTNENIKVFVSGPLTIINVVTCNNGIHLIAAVVTLITHRRKSTRNTAETLAVWCNGCQFELHLNVCRHTLKIGVHIGSIGILLAIVAVQYKERIENLFIGNVFHSTKMKHMEDNRDCINSGFRCAASFDYFCIFSFGDL